MDQKANLSDLYTTLQSKDFNQNIYMKVQYYHTNDIVDDDIIITSIEEKSQCVFRDIHKYVKCWYDNFVTLNIFTYTNMYMFTLGLSLGFVANKDYLSMI